MTTKFNVGDEVLIKGIVETIYIETTDNKPVYRVRIEAEEKYYSIRVKEGTVKDGTPRPQVIFQPKTVTNAKEAQEYPITREEDSKADRELLHDIVNLDGGGE